MDGNNQIIPIATGVAQAERNLFNAEASSSNNTGAKPPTPPKTLHEHSHPNPSGLRNEDSLRYFKHYLSIVDNIQADGATRDTSRLRFFYFSLKGKAAEWLDRIPLLKSQHGISSYHDSLSTSFRIQKWLLVQIFHDNISRDDRRKLDQFAQFRFNSLTEEVGWNRIEEYVQYQDDLWDDMSPPMNVSSISEAMQPTFRGRLKRACNQITRLETPTGEVGLKNPYLICDYYGGSHEVDECKQTNLVEQGNSKRKEKGEDGPKWIVRNKFEDELANFMLEKKSHAKGIGNMLDQHRKELHEKFSQILSTIRKSETPEPEAPTFTITTRSEVSTQDPPFPAPPRPMSDNLTEGEVEKERPEGEEPSIIQEPTPRPSIFYQPSKLSNLPFPSTLKKQKKDERLLSIFKQIHINLPFLEAMIHMPKGADNLEVLEMDEDELVPIILGWPFLATARAIIDVHEGKLSLRVESKTVTFNSGKSMKSKHSRDDYLYCADHTAKLVQEQWVDTVNHDEKWIEEEEEDSNEVLAVSFHPRTKPENNQLPVAISSALSTVKKARLLEVLRNHKGAITWSIADIKGIDSSFCTHKILMEDEFKPSFQPQSDPWVSPVQVFPKKGGMTIVKNEKDELIP
ncbi:hypothetical protein Tco_0117732 [Tanacetum coccineum]